MFARCNSQWWKVRAEAAVLILAFAPVIMAHPRGLTADGPDLRSVSARGDNQGTASVNNTLFWGNAARDVQDETAQIAYTTLPLVRYCAIQGLQSEGALHGGNNVQNLGDAAGFDSAFVNAAAGNLRLLPDSPCLNNGDNTVLGLPADGLDGGARIVPAQSPWTAGPPAVSRRAWRRSSSFVEEAKPRNEPGWRREAYQTGGQGEKIVSTSGQQKQTEGQSTEELRRGDFADLFKRPRGIHGITPATDMLARRFCSGLFRLVWVCRAAPTETYAAA